MKGCKQGLSPKSPRTPSLPHYERESERERERKPTGVQRRSECIFVLVTEKDDRKKLWDVTRSLESWEGGSTRVQC